LAEIAGLTGDIKGCGRIKEGMDKKMCYESFVWDMTDMFLAERM